MRDPLLMEEAIFMKDDDDFSTDSWERVSNDDFVHIPTMVSQPTSPTTSATSTGESTGTTYIIEDDAEDTIRALNQLDSPPFLVSQLLPHS